MGIWKRRFPKAILLGALVLSCPLPLCAEANSYSGVRELADRLRGDGAYLPAILEYRRYLFFSDRDGVSVQPDAILYLSQSYAQVGRYDAALEYLQRYRVTVGDPFAQYLYELELLALSDNIDNLRLRAYVIVATESYDHSDRFVLYAINYLYAARAYDIAMCREVWPDLQPFLSTQEAMQISEAFSRYTETPPRNPRTASILSGIVPGTGQAYAGYPFQGFNSLALIAGLGVFTGFAIADERFIDAAFIGAPYLLRFYIGGINRASDLAEEGNREDENAFAAVVASVLAPKIHAEFRSDGSVPK